MALNLSRNTKVYFTTNVAANTGVVASSGFTNSNTWEIAVLDGYKFSQATNQQTIQANEAGVTPSRGQRSFNTELAPVDWNFATYIRPELSGGKVICTEKYLWNALNGSKAISTSTNITVTGISRTATTTGLCTATGAAGFGSQFAVNDYVNFIGTSVAAFDGTFKVLSTASTTITFTNPYLKTTDAVTATGGVAGTGQWFEGSTAYSVITTANSNSNSLQLCGLVFRVDNIFYAVDNAVIDKADIDFGIDAIAQVAWSGKGSQVRDLAITSAALITSTGFAAITAPSTTAKFITNKLSTLTVVQGFDGTGTSYTIPITGGNVSISNNITYLTPQVLGTVNIPIGYSLGARSVSGTINAYLKTGTNESSTLLKDILTGAGSSTENTYSVTMDIGGITNTVKVSLDMPATMLQVPTVDVQDIVSTSINFTAQAFDPLGSTNATAAYNMAETNELNVRYYAA
jgi:hypothetical protein